MNDRFGNWTISGHVDSIAAFGWWHWLGGGTMMQPTTLAAIKVSISSTSQSVGRLRMSPKASIGHQRRPPPSSSCPWPFCTVEPMLTIQPNCHRPWLWGLVRCSKKAWYGRLHNPHLFSHNWSTICCWAREREPDSAVFDQWASVPLVNCAARISNTLSVHLGQVTAAAVAAATIPDVSSTCHYSACALAFGVSIWSFTKGGKCIQPSRIK